MTALRYATRADASAVAALRTAAARAFGPGHYTGDELAHWTRERDPDACDFDEGVHLVAERDGDSVGWGWVRPERCELSGVAVHPDHARDGVGTRLLERLESEAADAGCEALSVWAALPAVGFYDANGYECVRRVTLDSGSAALPHVVMRKHGGVEAGAGRAAQAGSSGE
ncbi:GNAT family N-acetyltransferase [Salarchaeum sp. JOR-1]|uniref:GNAT family N-acetyltransferase n=1 Tax=Salarchaeum sp. JOR-1 TaxID=2599399 RepID=UPI0011987EEB|nr:GNAT family N-acetyltransferase [Salarchaeum sp. JOR-1]QDX41212.1 GNAT family N-acetyltransferase [Salarchaeum sp. JOR-1]